MGHPQKARAIYPAAWGVTPQAPGLHRHLAGLDTARVAKVRRCGSHMPSAGVAPCTGAPLPPDRTRRRSAPRLPRGVPNRPQSTPPCRHAMPPEAGAAGAGLVPVHRQHCTLARYGAPRVPASRKVRLEGRSCNADEEGDQIEGAREPAAGRHSPPPPSRPSRQARVQREYPLPYVGPSASSDCGEGASLPDHVKSTGQGLVLRWACDQKGQAHYVARPSIRHSATASCRGRNAWLVGSTAFAVGLPGWRSGPGAGRRLARDGFWWVVGIAEILLE